jgi:light-regulated signal transduction histidine kinase (bacteriophytochrome)
LWQRISGSVAGAKWSEMMAPQPQMSREEAVVTQALLSGLTKLSARAGHDLLGSLNQAGALLALFIKRHRNQLGADADQLLDYMQSASTRMEGVVAGVRKYMDIAGRPPRFGPVDLNMTLATSLGLLEKPIAESGAVIAADPLPVVSADAAQMVTIFEVLIGNSIKFRRPDAPPRIEISLRQAGDTRSVAISDNGIGIEPEYSEMVFQPFKRLKGAEYPGAGLGLATAKLITEMHGGNIRIDKVPDCEESPRGMCVQFTVVPE